MQENITLLHKICLFSVEISSYLMFFYKKTLNTNIACITTISNFYNYFKLFSTYLKCLFSKEVTID